MATADRVSPEEFGKLFVANPDKGLWWTAIGAKGSGKSDTTVRLFETYPYDGILIDDNADLDPEHRFTKPLPLPVPIDWPEPADDEPRFQKFRYVPDFLSDNWLAETDEVIGLAFRRGYCMVHIDEAGDHLPANGTPRWSRLTLRQGRHRHLSLGLPMPRPSEVNTLSMSQADVLTMHSLLHERDVERVARYVRIRQRELEGMLEGLDEDRHEFIAYVRSKRLLLYCEGLPPRRHAYEPSA